MSPKIWECVGKRRPARA